MQAPQIRSLVDQFVADLQVVIRQEALDAVSGALGGQAAPARRGPGRPRKASTRGAGRPTKKTSKRGRPKKAVSRGRRSPEEVEALGALVLDHVKANPGQRLEEIGEGMGMATKELKRPITNLMEDGHLRTEGQKRGTKYFAGGRAKHVSNRKTAKKKATRKKATKRKASKKSAKAKGKTTRKKARKVVPQ